MPSSQKAAIQGTDYTGSKPIKLTINASGGSVQTTTTDLTPGAYTLLATTPCLVAHGATLTAPDGSQGTGTTGSFGVPAGTAYPISIAAAGKLSTISVDSATGVLIISGPIYRGNHD